MYIIRGSQNIPDSFRGGAVTIGNFDGVHCGHQAIFAALQERARLDDLPTVAITFEPHPRRLIRPNNPPVRITGVRGKARWMERYGVDAMFILRFSRTLASLDAESFVRRYLVEDLGVRVVRVGYNFRFGARGTGDIATLSAFGKRWGFEVHEQPPHVLAGDTVSSTRIREAIHACEFATAEQLLGRPFEIEGRVGSGQKRGRGLGFPTANLGLSGLLHPPSGVYVVEGWIGGEWVPAVANVGTNPTFGDEGLHLEAHMLAPCGDLYRKVLRIRFLAHLRSEVRFSGPDALIAQITEDVNQAKCFFASRHEQAQES
ncbi:MAG: bifunctional riboflavin kinase/FAD synthetase [Magnetococcales bacterium]|nr:bifunctional riboflavin kinase/FAD synthetase [Magnetococcales bacterium]